MVARRDFRKFNARRDDREGIASVIGVIFALMIFMTLLALLVTSFVPAWEKGNELDFSNVARSQMGQVKGYVMDLKTQGDERYVPFQTAPSPVPLFGRPYWGELNYSYGGDGASVMTITYGSNTEIARGSFSHRLINSHSTIEVIYEHGALILIDGKGDDRLGIVKSPPSISLYTSGGKQTLNITRIDMMDRNHVVTSSGTVGVRISLTQDVMSSGEPKSVTGPITITWESANAQAWADWAVAEFGASAVVNYDESTSTTTAVFSGVDYIEHQLLNVKISMEG